MTGTATFTPVPINGTYTVTVVDANTFSRANRAQRPPANASTTGATMPATYTDYYRDRVRAVVHLIVTSPDFTIQK